MALKVLKKPWQFREVYDNGKKFDGKFVVVFYYRSGESDDGPQVGIVASKRVGNAVQRNRARRLLRETAVRTLGGLSEPGLRIVLVARAAILNSSFPALLDEAHALLTGAGLINKADSA